MNDQKQGNNLATFIAGVVIGAALTYLFGTKNGQKIKEQLLTDSAKLLEKMGENVQEGIKKLEEAEEDQQVRDKIEGGIQEVRSKVEDVAAEIPAHVAEIQKKGRRFFFRRSQTRQES